MTKKPNAANSNISLKISHAEQKDLKKLATAEHMSQSSYVRAIIVDRISFEHEHANPALTDDYEQPDGILFKQPATPATPTQEEPADSNPGNPATI